MPQERLIKMKCGGCERINYYTYKSKGKDPKSAEKKLELKKFCKWCRKHTTHKETRK
ncbi:MAG: 50S ribosomal protein L33 [Patescibacteria group bacterium]